MMPDYGRRMKADGVAVLLEAPAGIHIIAGDAIHRIETANGLESGFTDREIAAGNVLRNLVGHEYMNGAAGRARHAFGDSSVARRRKVRTADGGMMAGCKSLRKVREPVRIGIGIVVDVSDDVSRRRAHTGVA